VYYAIVQDIVLYNIIVWNVLLGFNPLTLQTII